VQIYVTDYEAASCLHYMRYIKIQRLLQHYHVTCTITRARGAVGVEMAEKAMRSLSGSYEQLLDIAGSSHRGSGQAYFTFFSSNQQTHTPD
jgi:hypothetical protein